MKILRSILILLWRIWFYAWMLGTIIFLLPILVIVISKEKWYPIFFKIARLWANTLLFVMGFSTEVRIAQRPEKSKSYVYCPNHTSIIDILMMLSITKNPFVFVGKKELANIPVFGYIYKRTCILVDRNNTQSKIAVYGAAQKIIKNNLSVCIFPEGKVPDDESVILDTFQNGAFRLAIAHEIPIVPITFFDCKKRFSYTFFSGSPGKLRVKMHPFIETKSSDPNNRISIKNEVYSIIYESLIADESYVKSSLKNESLIENFSNPEI